MVTPKYLPAAIWLYAPRTSKLKSWGIQFVDVNALEESAEASRLFDWGEASPAFQLKAVSESEAPQLFNWGESRERSPPRLPSFTLLSELALVAIDQAGPDSNPLSWL